jgi:hypothetical protein
VLDAGRTVGLAIMTVAALASAALLPLAAWQPHVAGWVAAAVVGLGGYAYYRTQEVRASVRARFRNPAALGRVVAVTALVLFVLAGTHGYFLATEVAKL